MPKKIRDIKSYLLSRADCEPGSCWVWKFSRNKFGYGKIKIGGRNFLAHRLSLAVHSDKNIGDLSEVVMHSCDNPSCINPDHLSEGTHKLNVLDCFLKGRGFIPINYCESGEKNFNAVLTESDVKDIRDMILSGMNNKEIAKRFNVHHSTVSSIRVGRTWKEELQIQ